MKRINKKKSEKNKRIRNITINCIFAVVLIMVIIFCFNFNNIKTYMKNKEQLQKASDITEGKSTVKIYSNSSPNESYEIFLDTKVKKVYIITKTIVKEKIKTISVQDIALQKVDKIRNSDLIKLDLAEEAKNSLFACYINCNYANSKLYFSFTDNTTYETITDIKIPASNIIKILTAHGYTPIMDISSTPSYELLYSEIHNTIAILEKDTKTNKYTNLTYLNPHISKNNTLTENNVSSLLEEYKNNYDSFIDIKNYNNTVYNTRNTKSKFVTVITLSNNDKIFNIKPSGELYNIMFKANNNMLKNDFKIN